MKCVESIWSYYLVDVLLGFDCQPKRSRRPSSMATSERNNKILLDLVQQPGNNLCADCGAPGEYTSTDSGLIYRLALIDFYLFRIF